MKATFTWLAVGVLISNGMLSTALADYGPLQSTNRFPLHLMFLKPRPMNVHLPSEGGLAATLALEYSNTYFEESNSRWDVLVDMEMLVADLSIAWGLTPRLALKMDLPVVSMSNGFLDGFLGDYHDLIGVDNYDRENRPKDTFGYGVTKDGDQWIAGDNGGWQWADATLSLQYALLPPGSHPRLSSALMLSVKVPIGNERRGFGSGAFDYGLYWPTQWSGQRWAFYVMPSFALIGDPHSGGADISARNSYGLFCGVAYDYSERLSLVAQVNYYSSPLEKTGLSNLDDGTVGLDLGFHYLLKAGCIVEFAFCEDLTLSAPDFNVRLGLQWATKGW